VFGLVTLLLAGPAQFLHLRWWWLMGVLLVYTGGISVGGELMLLASYRGLGAITVALWGNAVVLVALASAHVLLGEPLGAGTLGRRGLHRRQIIAKRCCDCGQRGVLRARRGFGGAWRVSRAWTPSRRTLPPGPQRSRRL
ncbi:MAG: hypothetical protein VKO26_06720, partial [Cyanobacteriota bacterium]|nr:hypothetical protein [Cyanobacteriota bacterium]